MLHCAGCVTHGKLEDLKRITVHGDPCEGVDPDCEIVSLRAHVEKLTDEMNTIIQQKWDVEADRDALRLALAQRTAEVQRVVEAAKPLAWDETWGTMLAQMPVPIARLIVSWRRVLQDALAAVEVPHEAH